MREYDVVICHEIICAAAAAGERCGWIWVLFLIISALIKVRVCYESKRFLFGQLSKC